MALPLLGSTISLKSVLAVFRRTLSRFSWFPSSFSRFRGLAILFFFSCKILACLGSRAGTKRFAPLFRLFANVGAGFFDLWLLSRLSRLAWFAFDCKHACRHCYKCQYCYQSFHFFPQVFSLKTYYVNDSRMREFTKLNKV